MTVDLIGASQIFLCFFVHLSELRSFGQIISKLNETCFFFFHEIMNSWSSIVVTFSTWIRQRFFFFLFWLFPVIIFHHLRYHGKKSVSPNLSNAICHNTKKRVDHWYHYFFPPRFFPSYSVCLFVCDMSVPACLSGCLSVKLSV